MINNDARRDLDGRADRRMIGGAAERNYTPRCQGRDTEEQAFQRHRSRPHQSGPWHLASRGASHARCFTPRKPRIINRAYEASASMRNRVGFLLSQLGARPRPDQVAPVLGSRYFGGGCLRVRMPPRPRGGAISSTVSPYSAISPRIWATTAEISSCRFASICSSSCAR